MITSQSFQRKGAIIRFEGRDIRPLITRSGMTLRLFQFDTPL
jgi:hypothetical protein